MCLVMRRRGGYLAPEEKWEGLYLFSTASGGRSDPKETSRADREGARAEVVVEVVVVVEEGWKDQRERAGA